MATESGHIYNPGRIPEAGAVWYVDQKQKLVWSRLNVQSSGISNTCVLILALLTDLVPGQFTEPLCLSFPICKMGIITFSIAS